MTQMAHPAPILNLLGDIARLALVEEIAKLDRMAEHAIEQHAALAKRLLDARAAFVRLVYQSQVMFKVAVGPPGVEGIPPVNVQDALCTHALTDVDVTLVDDARQDARFLHHPLVRAEEVIAYAGAPLEIAGHRVGTLCVMDNRPHTWTPRDAEILRICAGGVQAEMQWRLQMARQRAISETPRPVRDEIAHLMMEQAKVATFEWSIRDNHIVWSDNLEGLLGLPPGGFGGTFEAFMAHVHVEDRARVQQALQQALHTGDYFCEFRMLRGDGSIRWTSTRGRVLHDADGSPRIMFGADLDITEHKQFEALLEAARNGSKSQHKPSSQVEALVEALPALVFVTDAKGKTTYVNSRGAEYAGGDVSRLLGDGWLDALHPDDRSRVRQIWMRAVASGQFYEAEYRLRRRDGTYRQFLCRAIPIRDAAGLIEHWYGVCTDVEDQRCVELQLRMQCNRLQGLLETHTHASAQAGRELSREMTRRAAAETKALHTQKLEALGELAGSIAHDFNNVLAAVAGAVNLLERKKLTEEQAHFLQFARRGVERGKQLVRRLVGFARTETPTPTFFDVAHTLESDKELLRQALGAGVDLVVLAPAGLVVLADVSQFELAMLNLAVNARDAMGGSGTVTISATTTLPGDPQHPASVTAQAVAVMVEDTGPGMAPEVLARATDAFFTTKAPGKGTGLGLAMVSAFARQFHGEFSLQSALGCGTQATLYLPRSSGLPEHAEVEEPPIDPEDHGNATLLVVETDELVRPMIGGYLRDLNYTVLEAADALSAYAMANAVQGVDALITCVSMPKLDGLGLAQSLRAERDIPVLFMASSTDEARLFGEHVLEKPFSQAALAHTLLKLLGRTDEVPLPGSRDAMQAQVSRIRRRLQDPDMLDCLRSWTNHWRPGHLPLLPQVPRSPSCAARCFVARREERPDSTQYRIDEFGASLADALGAPLPQYVSTKSDGRAGALAHAYERAARTRLPTYECLESNADGADSDGAPSVVFERLLLPLRECADGDAVTHMLGIVNAMQAHMQRSEDIASPIQQQQSNEEK